MFQTANLPNLARCASGVDLEDVAQPVPQMDDLAEKTQRRAILRRLLSRQMEGLKLYRPLPHLAGFHEANCGWRVIDGSNRSSKTLSGCVELIRAWLGVDPFDKYVKRNLNSLVVSLDLDHIGLLWRKCEQPGAFKIIADEQTGLPRSVRPDPKNPRQLDPYDEAYREKWRDAPPLIPPRMIHGEPAWEDRRKRVPRYVRFASGALCLFRSSDGRPPQGDHYHVVLFDEHIANPDFIAEAKRGLVGLDEPPLHRPKGIWTATAQSMNPELLELRERADAGSPDVRAWPALIVDNPYVPQEEKQIFHDSLSEDERRVRYYGEYASAARRCYPTYDPQGIHGFEPREIPPDWCRYLWIDPGQIHRATLFAAVDPEEKHVWVYDGFDLENVDLRRWAGEVRERLRGMPLEAAVIDQRAGRQKAFGAQLTVAEQYWAALLEAGIEPRQLGPLGGFFPGSDDIAARQAALRNWMALRATGPFMRTPVLKVARGQIAGLDRQVRHAQMEIRNPDKRAKLRDQCEDLVECLEYGAASGPRYFAPDLRSQQAREDAVYENFQQDRRRRQQAGRGGAGRYGYALEIG